MSHLQNLKKPIVVVGLGKSGRSVCTYLAELGFSSENILTFDEKITGDLKSWEEIKKLSAGTLVISPGVPLQSAPIKELKTMGWALTSEINIASQVLTDEVVIGITGSVGKSTVTSLLGAGALVEDKHAFVGGNLGTPFCDYATAVLKKKQKAKYVILELSSYQLENCKDLKLEYSAITYLSSNHLERYPSLRDYYLTKCDVGKITKKQCFINSASKDAVAYQNEVACKTILTEPKNKKIQLIGKHNLENYAVAEALATACGWSAASLTAMQNFTGLEHRLETVGVFDQILFINDSKATAIDSVLVATEAAIEKVQSNNKLHLLIGGKDKNLPWTELKKINHFKNIKITFFGQCGNLARTKSEISGLLFEKMTEAVLSVLGNAKSGDVVLLSPGGTSLDEFKNFEERGNLFKELIRNHYSKK